MKIPLVPPKFEFNQITTESFRKTGVLRPTTQKGEYIHWDKLRHLTSPSAPTPEQSWLLLKLARKSLYNPLPFNDKHGKSFVLATTNEILQQLHSLDRKTSNIIQNPSSFHNSQMRDTYLVQSLIEEAITSSQLEGASTTRKIAKEMLRTNRKPRDLSEQMIFNNYHAMQFIRDIKQNELTTDNILQLHALLTDKTLEDPNTSGKLRLTDDIHVCDNQDQILHTPPKAIELEARLKKLCQFANETAENTNYFIHPIIRAILLHFILAYDHPFADGNGRTARALFYWSMSHQNYHLMEYISISEIIKRAPSQYARAYLYTETDENDVTYFLIHQLDVIQNAIDQLFQYIETQNNERLEIEKLLHTNAFIFNQLNYRQIALIKHMLKHANALYTIEGHRQSHHITYQTARTDLLNLEKFGLLVQQPSKKAFLFAPPSNLQLRITRLNTDKKQSP